MPRLWRDTIDAHRQEVRDAILATTVRLAAAQGPLHVTMSQIAEGVGISRATLYKYFPGVEEILRVWHDHQMASHLQLLTSIADRDQPAMDRLSAVLEAYAQVQRRRGAHTAHPHGRALAALLHDHDRVSDGEARLHALLRSLLEDAAAQRQVRRDIPAQELTQFCLHAAAAAEAAPSDAAAQRLVRLILAGLTA